MATLSSILAWTISWTEQSGGLQSIRSQRVTSEATEYTHTHALIHTHTRTHSYTGVLFLSF